jgi:hypothetical protein
MNKDGFVVNQNNYLQMKRIDRSSLSVTDQEGNVINARFANPTTFIVNGKISIPGRGVIPIPLKGMERTCVGDSSDADISID